MKRKIMFNSVYPVLESLKSKNNTYLQYFIIKNTKKIKEELDIAKDLLKDEEYDNYTKKRIELCEKYSDRDENNKPKLNNNSYVISEENTNKFNSEISTLQNEYQLIIEGFIKKENEVLEEDIKIDFYKIKLDNLPKDLSNNDLAVLELMNAVIE